ncbi:hypothetical protein [Streptomyces olivochromogenes]|uniref:hypothetical protein n=1 Tax=Streptomyces olivochromogenes TaxID=1963 RepID=UPI0036C1BE21
MSRLRLWEKCPIAHWPSVAGRRADGPPPTPSESRELRVRCGTGHVIAPAVGSRALVVVVADMTT